MQLQTLKITVSGIIFKLILEDLSQNILICFTAIFGNL